MTQTLTRTQARNQVVNVGGFPSLHTDPMEHDIAGTRPEQDELLAMLLPRISAGRVTIVGGRMGRGKTWISCLIAFKWYERGLYRSRGKARYWTMTSLLNEQKAWYGLDNSKRGEEPLKKALDCALLFIDEVLTHADSIHDQTQIRELLDARYRSKRATVLLTNLATDGLVKALDSPTIERAIEGDNGFILTLGGESNRTQQNNTHQRKESK